MPFPEGAGRGWVSKAVCGWTPPRAHRAVLLEVAPLTPEAHNEVLTKKKHGPFALKMLTT
jgi:hypothetical protein